MTSGHDDFWKMALYDEYGVRFEGPQDFLKWSRAHLTAVAIERCIQSLNELEANAWGMFSKEEAIAAVRAMMNEKKRQPGENWRKGRNT